MKYDTFSDAMPKLKRRYVHEAKAWDDLLEAVHEAVKRLRAQAVRVLKTIQNPVLAPQIVHGRRSSNP